MRGALALLLLLISLVPARAQTPEYYALQMAWLPGQCLAAPDMAACDGLTLENRQGRNLTLIGLQPTARPGLTALRDCDPMSRAFTTPVISPDDKVTSCSLPELTLSADIRAALDDLMPDIAACPEREYWRKYGSCALLSPQRYFERAVARAQEVQHSLLNLTIAGAVGQRISRALLVDAFEQQFGQNSAQSLQLVCAKSKLNRQPVLTELRVALNQLGTMRTLSATSLWSRKGHAFKDRCPTKFLVAEPGVEEPAVPEQAPISEEAPFAVEPAFPQP